MEKKTTTRNKMLQMTRLIGKCTHIVKVRNHPHINMIKKTRNLEKGVQMQDTGGAFAIKKPET